MEKEDYQEKWIQCVNFPEEVETRKKEKICVFLSYFLNPEFRKGDILRYFSSYVLSF